MEWINRITENPQIWDPCVMMLVVEDPILIHDLMMYENGYDLANNDQGFEELGIHLWYEASSGTLIF